MSDGLNRILLVEDNPGDARLLREALRDVTGYQFNLDHVERLSQALERLRGEHFDVVLLDLSLPDGQGLDNLARVRDAAPSVPILVLTGLNDEEVAVKAVRVGAQDYLLKGQADGSSVVRAMRYARERKGTEEQIQRHLKRMTALRDINLAITSTLDLSTVLNVLLEKIDLLLTYDSVAAVRLFNKETGRIEPITCRNFDEKDWKDKARTAEHGISDVVFEAREPVKIRNVQKDPRTRDPEFFRKNGLFSYLGVPLMVRDEILGVLSFYTKEEHDFSNEEIEFFSMIAGQAAIAIHNSQLYEQTKKQAVELEQSNNVKDEFLSVISHELRTPLNVVMNYAELVRDGVLGKVNPEQVTVLNKVLSHARNQLNLINSVLHATRMGFKETRLCSDEVDLGEFLDDLKSEYEISLSKKDLSVCWDLPSELPRITVDRDKLRQILENLINNAVKFTEKGSVSISAAFIEGSRFQADGNTRQHLLQFKVADTGIGIPEEAVRLIFEKFYQVDGSSTRIYGGVGIGLYIVKNFTELLGGEVSVETEVGKGSTFTVTIPYDTPYSPEKGSAKPFNRPDGTFKSLRS